VEDRIAGVLPSLVDESRRREPEVFHEAVVIFVPVGFHPGERQLDVGPELADQLEVPGPPGVRAREHHEERRRVHASVVASERDLPQRGHFPAAHLVEDLSGLRVPLEILLLRLGLGQKMEHSLGESGIHPEHLQRGDDPVTR
jgi:hypothetical protein